MKRGAAGRDFARGSDVDRYWQEYQRRRWLRPNAHLYVRPDAALWQQPNRRIWQAPDLTEQKYSPNQPRVPAGNPTGGQWTTVSSGGGISIAMPAFSGFEDGDAEDGANLGTDSGLDGVIELPAIDVTANDDDAFDRDEGSARVQLAGDVPTGGLPTIPKERPPTTRLRNIVVRALTRSLGRRIWFAVEAGSWVYDHKAEINSFFDSPKSLEEIQNDANKPLPGYDIHHVVEQSSAAKDGSEDDLIDAPENLVRIPRWKHWEINAFYQTPNDDFGGLTPRQYLEGKSWDERTRVGLDALRRFGVLRK